jgi:hypothetical protein
MSMRLSLSAFSFIGILGHGKQIAWITKETSA